MPVKLEAAVRPTSLAGAVAPPEPGPQSPGGAGVKPASDNAMRRIGARRWRGLLVLQDTDQAAEGPAAEGHGL